MFRGSVAHGSGPTSCSCHWIARSGAEVIPRAKKSKRNCSRWRTPEVPHHQTDWRCSRWVANHTSRLRSTSITEHAWRIFRVHANVQKEIQTLISLPKLLSMRSFSACLFCLPCHPSSHVRERFMNHATHTCIFYYLFIPYKSDSSGMLNAQTFVLQCLAFPSNFCVGAHSYSLSYLTSYLKTKFYFSFGWVCRLGKFMEIWNYEIEFWGGPTTSGAGELLRNGARSKASY